MDSVQRLRSTSTVSLSLASLLLEGTLRVIRRTPLPPFRKGGSQYLPRTSEPRYQTDTTRPSSGSSPSVARPLSWRPRTSQARGFLHSTSARTLVVLDHVGRILACWPLPTTFFRQWLQLVVAFPSSILGANLSGGRTVTHYVHVLPRRWSNPRSPAHELRFLPEKRCIFLFERPLRSSQWSATGHLSTGQRQGVPFTVSAPHISLMAGVPALVRHSHPADAQDQEVVSIDE